MFKLYSKGCEYALRLLARVDPELLNTRFTAQDCCRRTRIPEAFTRKTLQSLSRNGVLIAASGRRGGYRLAKAPDRVSVLELVEAVEGKTYFDACVMGKSVCSGKKPCPLHESWLRSKEPLIGELRRLTLLDLIKRNKQN